MIAYFFYFPLIFLSQINSTTFQQNDQYQNSAQSVAGEKNNSLIFHQISFKLFIIIVFNYFVNFLMILFVGKVVNTEPVSNRKMTIQKFDKNISLCLINNFILYYFILFYFIKVIFYILHI